jgi:hypothetical protein
MFRISEFARVGLCLLELRRLMKEYRNNWDDNSFVLGLAESFDE